MEYIAHISEDKEHIQTVMEHLEGTAELARQFSDAFGFGDWGYCCGKLHDIGKYSQKFQKRIRGSEVRVDHATAGAKACHEKGGFYTASQGITQDFQIPASVRAQICIVRPVCTFSD